MYPIAAFFEILMIFDKFITKRLSHHVTFRKSKFLNKHCHPYICTHNSDCSICLERGIFLNHGIEVTFRLVPEGTGKMLNLLEDGKIILLATLFSYNLRNFAFDAHSSTFVRKKHPTIFH